MGPQVANRDHERSKRLIVTYNLLFQFVQLLRKLLVSRDHLSQTDEGSDDKDAHFHGTRRI